MSLQLELTVLQLAYLIYFKPFDGSFAQNIEEFNEWCTLFIITTLFCMTDFVPSKEVQYLVGFFFIIVIALNLGVHLYFLLKDVFKSLCESAKKKLTKKVPIGPQTVKVPRVSQYSRDMQREYYRNPFEVNIGQKLEAQAEMSLTQLDVDNVVSAPSNITKLSLMSPPASDRKIEDEPKSHTKFVFN